MKSNVQIISLVGMMVTMGLAGYAVVQLNGQSAAPTGDYRNAAVAEVRDAQGQIVLQGSFAAVEEEDDDVERKATLTPTGVDADAAGEAEIEFTMAQPAVQEVEFAVRNLQPGLTFTFVIDGNDIASATADRDGEAEVELEVGLPGATASR